MYITGNSRVSHRSGIPIVKLCSGLDGGKVWRLLVATLSFDTNTLESDDIVN